MNYYPEWLGEQVINDEFDWSQASSASMPHFLAQYTLHDSYWIGFHVQPYYEGLAILRWDTFWSKERVPFPGSTVAEWPILLIQFERLYQLHSTYLGPKDAEGCKWAEIISSAESELLTDADKEKMLGWLTLDEQEPTDLKEFVLDEVLYHTVFHPVYGGRVDVWHGGATRFLCLNREGNPLHIPDL